jgi:hypothetical protein
MFCAPVEFHRVYTLFCIYLVVNCRNMDFESTSFLLRIKVYDVEHEE